MRNLLGVPLVCGQGENLPIRGTVGQVTKKHKQKGEAKPLGVAHGLMSGGDFYIYPENEDRTYHTKGRIRIVYNASGADAYIDQYTNGSWNNIRKFVLQ